MKNDTKTSGKAFRPLPYYTVGGGTDDKRLAAALRREFIPKLGRLLAGHHLRGFPHEFIVNFVQRHKKKYPCFVRADIKQFYPSVRHRDLVVGMQIAYRDLLNLDYVPRSFKDKYVAAVNRWCQDLPLHKGLPLGSPLSAILAPVMLLPLWLAIKRRFGVPFLVYMDDMMICTADESQSMEIYAFIDNYLYGNYELELNAQKTCSGRFSRDGVDFCGWRFAGGYATVSKEKQEAFKGRVTQLLRKAKAADARALLKRLNRKIDGFGHYYKFGNVSGEFRRLDMYIRGEVRKWFSRVRGTSPRTLREMIPAGLRSLSAIHGKLKGNPKPEKSAVSPVVASVPRCGNPSAAGQEALDRMADMLEKIQAGLSQLIRLERRHIRLMEELLNLA